MDKTDVKTTKNTSAEKIQSPRCLAISNSSEKCEKRIGQSEAVFSEYLKEMLTWEIQQQETYAEPNGCSKQL